ncbi:MAG: hypothetical protein COB73_05330 [Flavobacteriaceae bacterium]|nr:MAG: hypothetical protein COB73_05330 [Flavobacteriaceae bacterium]
MENKKVIVLLGGLNSSKGELGEISLKRLDKCLEIYSEETFVLCTGGWGTYFNTTIHPHAYYSKNYLIKKGVLEGDILDLLLSKNTVDDAVLIKKYFSKPLKYDLTIVTTDFHLERVQLIFKEILVGFNLNWIGVKNSLSKEELKYRVAHEKKAIQGIIKNGLYY